jgi:hypothetical protein
MTELDLLETHIAAREDAIRVKKFVHSSGPSRPRDLDSDEPTPTQRASGSLDAVSEPTGLSRIMR